MATDFVDRKPTMELRWVLHKVWYGPNPFDVRMEKRLEQKFEVVRGGMGKTVYDVEWIAVPCISEEMVK